MKNCKITIYDLDTEEKNATFSGIYDDLYQDEFQALAKHEGLITVDVSCDIRDANKLCEALLECFEGYCVRIELIGRGCFYGGSFDDTVFESIDDIIYSVLPVKYTVTQTYSTKISVDVDATDENDAISKANNIIADMTHDKYTTAIVNNLVKGEIDVNETINE